MVQSENGQKLEEVEYGVDQMKNFMQSSKQLYAPKAKPKQKNRLLDYFKNKRPSNDLSVKRKGQYLSS